MLPAGQHRRQSDDAGGLRPSRRRLHRRRRAVASLPNLRAIFIVNRVRQCPTLDPRRSQVNPCSVSRRDPAHIHRLGKLPTIANVHQPGLFADVVSGRYRIDTNLASHNPSYVINTRMSISCAGLRHARFSGEKAWGWSPGLISGPLRGLFDTAATTPIPYPYDYPEVPRSQPLPPGPGPERTGRRRRAPGLGERLGSSRADAEGHRRAARVGA